MTGMGQQKKLLSTPTDIEGHRGKDGRFYVLDFARVFPPEHPTVAGISSLVLPFLFCLYFVFVIFLRTRVHELLGLKRACYT